MSSLVRSIEKRVMKRAGFTREKWIIVKGLHGEPQIRRVHRGGEITDHEDSPIGRHWPARIPAEAKFPTRRQPVNFRNPKALRHSKKTKRWLAQRAARRAA